MPPRLHSVCHSHLEAVDTVVLGKTRAKQYYTDDPTRTRSMPILLHGDGAFSGQGIVFETLDMSGLTDYTVGGTVHLVVNNQVCLQKRGKRGKGGWMYGEDGCQGRRGDGRTVHVVASIVGGNAGVGEGGSMVNLWLIVGWVRLQMQAGSQVTARVQAGHLRNAAHGLEEGHDSDS